MSKFFVFLFSVMVYSYAAADLRSDIDSIRLQFQLPGLAVATITDSQTQIVTTGVRKMGEAAPLQETDLFHLGSCTKAMNASLLAIWIERGRLQWTTRLSEIFPELALHPDLTLLTLQDLAAHRSGLTDDMFAIDQGRLWSQLFSLSGPEGRRLSVQTLLSQKPKNPVGSSYLYSNWNAILIGAALEKVSGRDWEELLQKELLAPLQMTSCVFGSSAETHISQPWPHVYEKQKYLPLSLDGVFDNPRAFAPAGTLRCTIDDWARFLRWQTSGARGEPTELLSSVTFQKLHSAPADQDYTYGGWLRLYRSWAQGFVLHHSGSNTMNFATVWIAPSLQKSFVAVTNAGGAPAVNATDLAINQLISF